MIGWTAAIVVAGLLAAAPAGAAQRILSYQAVMHVVESSAFDVLDEKRHQLGTGRFRGLAIFPNREIAIHRYEGWFDLSTGSGRYEGYMLFDFDDGSQLRAAYAGTVGRADPEDFEIQADIGELSGTGRFAGASGHGSFHGRRLEPIANGGTTYLEGSLTVELPD